MEKNESNLIAAKHVYKRLCSVLSQASLDKYNNPESVKCFIVNEMTKIISQTNTLTNPLAKQISAIVENVNHLPLTEEDNNSAIIKSKM